MPLPVVAIVGRPNVGKSSLFNWVANRRISIVDPVAGVTRDRVATTVEVDGRYFDLMDTGGMGIVDCDNLTADVEHQIRVAIDSASLVLFVVDIRSGVTPLDQVVAERLRAVAKPVVFVANKADVTTLDAQAADLYSLGYGEAVLVSAEQKRGKDELFEAILAKLPPADDDNVAPGTVELKLAIVGRQNAGKSTFINSLAEADRVIVSEVAGTTRDSIDVRFERDGKTFLAIDTAGVQKKKSLVTNVDFYSLHRAERSIRRADVVLHLFDPRLRVSRVDKQLAEYIVENNKPAIFVVNKWDLAKDTIPTEKWATYLRTLFPMLDYVPIAFITAKNGKNVYKLLNLAQQLHKQSGKRVSTGELNRVVAEAMLTNMPPMRLNKLPKIYYCSQTAIRPPTIVMMTNGPELFDPPYLRYLSKVFRENFPFSEVAIKMVLRDKHEGGGGKRGNRPDEANPVTPAADDTLVVPALAAEPIADAVVPVKLPNPPSAPPAPKPKKRPSLAPKKRKPEGGTWDI